MERISFVVLILHISFSQATQAMSTVQAQRGNELKLQCSEKHMDRTVWYGQKCNELPFIVIAVIDADHSKMSPTYVQGHNQRFQLDWEPNTASYGLTIKDFNDSDQGFYYCSVGDGGYTIIVSGFKVSLEEQVNPPTQPSVTANATVTSDLHEENDYRQQESLALWPIISLTVSGVALWGIYIIQKQPRRKKLRTHDEIKHHEGVYTTVYFTSS